MSAVDQLLVERTRSAACFLWVDLIARFSLLAPRMSEYIWSFDFMVLFRLFASIVFFVMGMYS